MPQIPAGWKETTLGEVVEFIDWDRGKNYPNWDDFKTTWFCVFLNAKNLPNRIFDFSETMFISEEKDLILRKGKLKRWDYVMTTRWTIGNFAYYNDQVVYSNMRINSWMVIIRAYKDLINEKFLWLFFSSNIFKYYLSWFTSWSAVPQLPIKDIKQLPIHLPPLPEQQAIAAVLSSFDDKMELLRAENQTLEQMGQELFKERFGKWKVGDELPEGWRVGKITEIIRRESISYKCDKKDLDDKGLTPILDQGSTGLYGYTSRDPDFIATKDSPVIIFTNHTCNFWFIDYPFCAIQNVLPYRWINGYDEYFLYFMTKGSIKFTEYKGHRPSFVALDFVIPPVELAQEFSKIAEGILKKISWNKEQIQTLSATRDQLLPKLMSGEVRVEF